MDKTKKKYYAFDKNLNLVEKIGPEIKKNRKTGKFTLANYTEIGYYLITPLLIGVFLGLYISRIAKNGIFMIIGILVGAIATFYNLIRLTKNTNAENQH